MQTHSHLNRGGVALSSRIGKCIWEVYNSKDVTVKESEGIWTNLNSRDGDSPILGQSVEIPPYFAARPLDISKVWVLCLRNHVLG